MAFPTGWTCKAALVVQHSFVTADQTAFPVLITEACFAANCPEILTSGNPNAAQSNGGDLRFSTDSAGASQIACEVVIWSPNATFGSAKAEIWVPRDILTASDVALYVWWKAGGGLTQPAANAAFGSQAVWGSAYAAVYHLGDGSTLSLADSTANGYTLVNVASVGAAPGKIGGAANYPSGGRSLTRSAISQLIGVTRFTVSLWVNVTTYGSSGVAFFSRYPNDFTKDILFSAGGTSVSAQIDSGSDGGASYTEDVRGSWHYMVLVFDGSLTGNANRMKIFSQGAQKTLSFGGYTVPAATSSATGFNQDINQYIDTTWGCIGLSDEVRIAPSALSAAWIATEYANQNSPGAFVIAGARISIGPQIGVQGIAAAQGTGQAGVRIG